MHPELADEVRAFASGNGHPIADFKGDCSARYPWLTAPRSCENVSAMIEARLRFSQGLLVSSALLNVENIGEFAAVNREYGGLYEFESLELARYRNAASGRDWKTLFVLHGFQITDVIPAYLALVSSDLQCRHVPVCYLDCYNERVQRRMIEMLPRFLS